MPWLWQKKKKKSEPKGAFELDSPASLKDVGPCGEWGPWAFPLQNMSFCFSGTRALLLQPWWQLLFLETLISRLVPTLSSASMLCLDVQIWLGMPQPRNSAWRPSASSLCAPATGKWACWSPVPPTCFSLLPPLPSSPLPSLMPYSQLVLCVSLQEIKSPSREGRRARMGEG